MQLTHPPAVDVTETMPTGPDQRGTGNLETRKCERGTRNSNGRSLAAATPVLMFRVPHSAFRLSPSRRSHPALPIPPAHPSAWTHSRVRGSLPAPADRLSSPLARS